MKKNLLCIATLIACCALDIFAQDRKFTESYNYVRGFESLQNNDINEALSYFNKELEVNPGNGYAFVWIASLRNNGEEYGLALTAANLAIKNLPKKDKQYQAFAYTVRAETYLGLNENEKALKDYTSAIKEQPEDADGYEKRADLYYYLNQYELADKDYHKIISLDPGSVMGYMGLGRNANAQSYYYDAIKQFDYVLKLAPEYSSGHSFRAESYIELQKYDLAINDIIKALAIDNDNRAFYLLRQVADSSFVSLVTKLKVQMLKEKERIDWPYYLGIVHEEKPDYNNAIDYYKNCMKINPSNAIAYRIASCYYNLGFYEQALDYCEQAISLDSQDSSKYVLLKAGIQNDTGMTKESMEAISTYISIFPDDHFGYYQRGWFKDHSGDLSGALEDYSISITLNPERAHVYLNRGNVNKALGKENDANRDFEQVILLDTIPNDESIAQYAFLYLGQKEKAIEWQDKVLAEKDDKGSFYDAACLYSIMNEIEKSLNYLEKSLKNGFRRFAHIRRDRDLNNIRELPEFELLIEKYERQYEWEKQQDVIDESGYMEETVEIPFAKEGDMLKVTCKINGLPLHLILDTGASDISLSSVEAAFMLKNGYIKSNDFVGKQNYMTASGEISEGVVVNLRVIDLGGAEFNNIKASIVKHQKAPILLGQSVLNKFGKIEIDNKNNLLKIMYKKENK